MKYLGSIILVVLLLVGCSEATIERVEVSPAAVSPAEKEADKAAEEPSNAPEIFSIGDTVKFDDLQLTLNGVRTSKGDDFNKPDEDLFLIVDMTIENTGDKPEGVSTLLQMSLYDSESYQYSIALFTDKKGSLDGEVAPGRKVRGEVAFDVPKSEFYEFVFEDLFTSGQAIWKFKAE